MSTKFFTNQDGNTLLKKFEGIFEHTQVSYFDALVGFFYASGYFRVRDLLKNVAEIRILVGIEVDKMILEAARKNYEFNFNAESTREEFIKELRADIQKAEYSKDGKRYQKTYGKANKRVWYDGENATKNIKHRINKKLLWETRFRCAYCGQLMTASEKPIDHFIPNSDYLYFFGSVWYDGLFLDLMTSIRRADLRLLFILCCTLLILYYYFNRLLRLSMRHLSKAVDSMVLYLEYIKKVRVAAEQVV